MEALICKKPGDPTIKPDSLSSQNNTSTTALTISTTYPIPKLDSPNSVLVRIIATSLNYATYLQVLGQYQEKFPYPFVLGSDYSGIVESVGPNVTKFKVGDRVCSFAGVGSFAQFIVAHEHDLQGVPDGCDIVAAAAIPLAYGTSYQALVYRANLKPGQVLLVLGAAGGVGLAAVQIGKICGAIVIAVSRETEKVEFLKSSGADYVVDLSKGGLIESVNAILKKRKLNGVDVLYDPVGGKLMKDSMKLLKWGAQILVIGFASGEVPVIPANIALVKNWTIHGFYLGNSEAIKPGVTEDSLKELLSWLARGLLKINIYRTYKLQEVHLAFSDIRDRKVIGKVMITFDDTKSLVSSRL
uniref:quinone oxidoreductase-like protein 2 homolog n=1 Tax=Erigeron canadensis TaxID=72917 RepID=UPI001CB8FED6|nr:quinone oxidoreductase-like protein 2 homolog [Erigeron canadensis]